MRTFVIVAVGVFYAAFVLEIAFGKAVVTTASELADAIRRRESVISIESRITGTANEQLEQNSGVYALQRYEDFPEVLSLLCFHIVTFVRWCILSALRTTQRLTSFEIQKQNEVNAKDLQKWSTVREESPKPYRSCFYRAPAEIWRIQNIYLGCFQYFLLCITRPVARALAHLAVMVFA